MIFSGQGTGGGDEDDDGNDKVPEVPDDRLMHFISTAFGNFLQHVRSELLELSIQQQQRTSHVRAAQQASKAKKLRSHRKTPSENAADDEEMLRRVAEETQADEESDQCDEQIATAMSTLLLSVRRLASGLEMVPKTVITNELSSSLVDQTVGLAEAMVRRRVDQKFYALRLRVVEDCLAPFCQALCDLSQADGETKEDQTPPLLGSVQLASVALSDSLQLVDDTVRSILSTLEGGGGGHFRNSDGDDDDEGNKVTNETMLREAVEHSTKRFAHWLASAMEMLAGYESSGDAKLLLQAPVMNLDEGKANYDGILPNVSLVDAVPSLPNKASHISDDMSEISMEPSDGLVEMALLDLASSLQPTKYMVLAIAEMCRVAERSVQDSIQQSISTHGSQVPGSSNGPVTTGTSKRKTATGTMGDGLFSGEENQRNSRDARNPVSQRFRLASSRVFSLFALNRGHEAATLLCSTLPELASKAAAALQGPRSVVCQLLEIAKTTSQDCADLFGGSRRAGPIPDVLDDEYVSLTASRMNANNRTGLAFDVERMFVEKVSVFPHPNDIFDFQRNSVLSIIFKVAFKALAENTRLLRFSVQGYRQLKIDVEFIKWFLPHFIKDEALADGSNARTALSSLLMEVVQSAKDRCVISGECLYQEVEETNHARAAIRHYMAVHHRNAAPSFFLLED